MTIRIFMLGFFLLASCAPEDRLPSFTQRPTDNAPLLPTPEPILNQIEFLQTFESLCLTSPNQLKDFRSVATQLRLSEERSPERFASVYLNHTWRSSKDHEEHALEISVGSGDIIYEIVGNGSGLPIRQRSCSMAAYLNAYDEESQREFRKTITEDFLPIAGRLDYSAYTNDYQVLPQDISIDFELPSRGSYAELKPNSECPLSNPCWKISPHKISLNVVIGRIP